MRLERLLVPIVYLSSLREGFNEERNTADDGKLRTASKFLFPCSHT